MVTTDLEALWAGPFGDAYTARNRATGEQRRLFWQFVRALTGARTWLDVGCNVGGNLRWLPPAGRYGLDLNRGALGEARALAPGRLVEASAAALPFRDRAVDLVFTCGVLIHVRRDLLPGVVGEVARVAKRWVLLAEYGASGEEVIPWRGQDAALWRAPYGRIFQEHVPGFGFRRRGFLDRARGFDNVTWWLFEREGRRALLHPVSVS